MKATLYLIGAGLAAGAAIKSRTALPQITLDNIQELSHLPSNASEIQKRQYREALGGDFADPSLIGIPGGWVAYATSRGNGAGGNVPVAFSADFNTWEPRSDAMPSVPSWADQASPQIWAPDVNQEGGRYFMYFTAKVPGTPTPSNGGLPPAACHCIGVATSNSGPFGPFVDSGSPVVCPCDQGGAIDPAGYDDGVDRWLVWKVDGNNRGGLSSCGAHADTGYAPTPIMIQQVSRDGLRLQGGASTMLDNQGAANDGVVEAPSLYKIRDDLFVVFYSSHCYLSDDYDIEYAFANTITGPYVDRGILLSRPANAPFGPGGLDIDPNGSNVVFHGRTVSGGGPGDRSLFTGTVKIDGNNIHFGKL